jgi:receptor expression-enhancing protein 5/6
MSERSDDDTRWLCYWVICGVFFLIEAIFSLAIEYIPLYFEMKCVFLIALQWKGARYAEYLYNTYLRGIFDRFEPTIDDFLERYSQSAVKIQKVAEAKVTEAALDAVRKKGD